MRLFAAMLEGVVRWSKKPKGNKKYAIDLNDRTREEKIKKVFETIEYKECGCLPDCGCKE